MQANKLTPQALTAGLVGCAAEDLINFRTTEDGGAIVIAPDGRKLRFSAAQLENQKEKLTERPTNVLAGKQDKKPGRSPGKK